LKRETESQSTWGFADGIALSVRGSIAASSALSESPVFATRFNLARTPFIYTDWPTHLHAVRNRLSVWAEEQDRIDKDATVCNQD
jgi:hypothetical protein